MAGVVSRRLVGAMQQAATNAARRSASMVLHASSSGGSRSFVSRTSNDTPPKVNLNFVTVRDGIQARRDVVRLQDKFGIVRWEDNAYIGSEKDRQPIEVTSFVPLPQFKGDSADLIKRLQDTMPDVPLSALVLNARGMEAALKAGIQGVGIVDSQSPEFLKRNMKSTPEEMLERNHEIFKLAKGVDLPVHVKMYISGAMGGLPFGEELTVVDSAKLARMYYSMGVDSIVPSDTSGKGSEQETKELFDEINSLVPRGLLGVHLHAANGDKGVLTNMFAAIDSGVKSVDVSTAMTGGCPSVPDAPHNLDALTAVCALTKAGYLANYSVLGVYKATAKILGMGIGSPPPVFTYLRDNRDEFVALCDKQAELLDLSKGKAAVTR